MTHSLRSRSYTPSRTSLVALLATASLTLACSIDAGGDTKEDTAPAVNARSEEVVGSGAFDWAGPKSTANMFEIPASPVAETGPESVHGAMFTADVHLRAQPGNTRHYEVETRGAGQSLQGDSWKSRVASYAPATLSNQRLPEALTAANQTISTVEDSGPVIDTLELISDILPVSFNSGAVEKNLISYTPVRARWDRFHLPATTYNGFSGYHYDEPAAFDEVQERGAKFYCAARNARQHQNSSMMGKKAAFSMNVFGRDVSFLQIAPTLEFKNPKKRTSATADGAQAFEVGMEVGAEFTPIAGLGIPSMGQLAVPVSFVTGDAKRSTLGDLGPVTNTNVICAGGLWGCFFDITTSTRFRSGVKEVLHADAVAVGSRKGIHLSGDITVATFFKIVDLNMKPSIDVNLGVLKTHDSRSGIFWDTHRGWGPAKGWASTMQDPFYNDGAICLSNSTGEAEPNMFLGPPPKYCEGLDGIYDRDNAFALIGQDSFTTPQSPWVSSLGNPKSSPFATRLQMNDDHTFQVESSVTLGVGFNIDSLAFKLLRFGPFAVEPWQVDIGGIQATTLASHLFRDGVFGSRLGGSAAHLEDALEVTPALVTSLDLKKPRIGFDLKFGINLLFKTIEIRYPVEILPGGTFNIAQATHVFSDNSRVRSNRSPPPLQKSQPACNGRS